MTPQTQNQAILAYLETGARLTPLEALERFGCFRLSGRILELRRQGWNIASELIQVGQKRVAQYRLCP